MTAVVLADLPLGPSLLLGLVLVVHAIVSLVERVPEAWTMQVNLSTGRYLRLFASGAVDEGEVVAADSVFPAFRLTLRPLGARFGQDCVFIPDTWWHPMARPWRLLVRAYRPVPVDPLLNPGA